MIDLVPSPLSAKGHWKRYRLELPLKPSLHSEEVEKPSIKGKSPRPLVEHGFGLLPSNYCASYLLFYSSPGYSWSSFCVCSPFSQKKAQTSLESSLKTIPPPFTSLAHEPWFRVFKGRSPCLRREMTWMPSTAALTMDWSLLPYLLDHNLRLKASLKGLISRSEEPNLELSFFSSSPSTLGYFLKIQFMVRVGIFNQSGQPREKDLKERDHLALLSA